MASTSEGRTGWPLNCATKWLATPLTKHATRNATMAPFVRCPRKYTTAYMSAKTTRLKTIHWVLIWFNMVLYGASISQKPMGTHAMVTMGRARPSTLANRSRSCDRNARANASRAAHARKKHAMGSDICKASIGGSVSSKSGLEGSDECACLRLGVGRVSARCGCFSISRGRTGYTL